MQDFNFNQTSSFSFEQLLQTMTLLKLGYFDTEQMYRRMALMFFPEIVMIIPKNFLF